MTFTCARCGMKFKGKNEVDAEIKFNTHTCKDKRDYTVWSDELLYRVASNQITEAQAWEIHDK